MREIRYDEYDSHRGDHEALLDQIGDILDDYEAGAFDDLTDTLSETLLSWFANHLKTHDARLHGLLGDRYPGIEEI